MDSTQITRQQNLSSCVPYSPLSPPHPQTTFLYNSLCIKHHTFLYIIFDLTLRYFPPHSSLLTPHSYFPIYFIFCLQYMYRTSTSVSYPTYFHICFISIYSIFHLLPTFFPIYRTSFPIYLISHILNFPYIFIPIYFIYHLLSHLIHFPYTVTNVWRIS